MKPCTVTIDLNAITNNLAVIRQHAPRCDIVGMVKANAYGHGITEVSGALSKAGLRRFGVATLAEGVALRSTGIEGDILLVAGATWMHSPEFLLNARLTPLISSAAELEILAQYLRQQSLTERFKIHLDLDTGMARTGVFVADEKHEQLNEVLEVLKKNPILDLVGVCTHFADVKEDEQQYSLHQIQCFDLAMAEIERAGFAPQVIHTAHSAALLRGFSNSSYVRTHRELQFWVRPGILLYGINPLSDLVQVSRDLRPAMRFEAPIVSRKRVPKGSFVGYGCTYCTQRETEVAVLGVGYADGYNRQLSNRGRVGIADRFAPVIGRISMDMTAIDVTDVVAELGPSVCALGERATLIGKVGNEWISAQELAKHCHTISYEILTSISHRVRREYV